jgi:LEA14-like dessication related protein
LNQSILLPVLGTVQIPVSRKASFPNFRIPKIKMQGIKLEKLSFTEAKLSVNININNPYTFSFSTNNFKYSLEVNGSQWMNGLLNRAVNFDPKSEQTLRIPISLNLLTLGTTAYQLFTGNSELDYRLKGQTEIKSSYQYLKAFNLPFEKAGKIKLTK